MLLAIAAITTNRIGECLDYQKKPRIVNDIALGMTLSRHQYYYVACLLADCTCDSRVCNVNRSPRLCDQCDIKEAIPYVTFK